MKTGRDTFLNCFAIKSQLELGSGSGGLWAGQKGRAGPTVWDTRGFQKAPSGSLQSTS